MRRAALIAVLAGLCRAQSPQEQALARQREAVDIQLQAIERQRTAASAKRGHTEGAARFLADSTPKMPAGLPDTRSQLESVERQVSALSRQRSLHGTMTAFGRPIAPIGHVPSSAEAPGQEPASGGGADPEQLQRLSSARQPRPAWPEPPSRASIGDCLPLPASLLSPIFERAASMYGLAPSLLWTVAQRESGLRPCAVSRAGALGLMQLMPETASWLGVSDPFDPEQSIHGGARFLRMLLDRFDNDLALALGAYNAGPGRVESYGGVPPFEETLDYVGTILRRIGQPSRRERGP